VPKILKLDTDLASLEELQIASNCCPTQKSFKKYLGIEFLYKGDSTQEVANRLNVTDRTVRNWIYNFNKEGIDSLAKKDRIGRPRRIPIDKFKAEYLPIVLDPSLAGEDSFTAIKFHSFLKNEKSEDLCYQTLLNYYHENRLSLVIPRPEVTDKQDPEKRAAFINEIKSLANKNKEIWFSDEVGFEGDPRPRARWVKIGSKPVNGRASEHIRFSAIGSINPISGEMMSLVVSGVDTEVFQIYLDEFDKATNSREIHLVLDNASWHKAAALNWHNIKPVFLAPYSPDHNPIENLWRFMKINYFNCWYAKSCEQLIDRICEAFNSLSIEQIQSTTNPSYLFR